MDDVTAANVKAIVELDTKHVADTSWAQRVAMAVARFCGSITFIVTHLVLFALWTSLNATHVISVDPYPFTFLTLMVSLEATFLTSFVMISQNRLSDVSDRRHKLDLQINLLAEQENTMTLRVLSRIAEKLGLDCVELEAYIEDVDPKKILENIEAHETPGV